MGQACGTEDMAAGLIPGPGRPHSGAHLFLLAWAFAGAGCARNSARVACERRVSRAAHLPHSLPELSCAPSLPCRLALWAHAGLAG